MKIDTEQLKQNNPIETVIAKYLDLKKDGSGFKACCPFHTEKTPSFNVNPNTQSFKCFGCDEGGDVVEFIMKYKGVEFKEACEILGAAPTPEEKHKPKPKPVAKKKPAKVVSLSYPEKAQAVFTTEALTKASGNLAEGRTLKKAWKFFNEKSEVDIVTARWEDPAGKKTVLTYYYDGKKIQLKGYPVLLYNRDKLATDQEKDVLIVFGEKCADVADSLGSFIAVTWNGGEKKVNDVDFGPLKNRTVYVWADDDQQKYANGPNKGQMMPPEEQPGRKCCDEVVKHLPHAQVVEFIPELREIEPSGADIVEALEYFGGDKTSVTSHIYESARRIEPLTDTTIDPKNESNNTENVSGGGSANTSNSGTAPDPKSWPFTILGIADDGKAYFIGVNGRLHAFDPTSLSKNKLMNLADIEWWWDVYGNTKDKMDEAVSDLIHISTIEDFDVKRLRGRGAWAEPDGRICYYDGRKITGEYDESRIFLRRPRKDIGINDKPASAKDRKAIVNICDDLTFKTMADSCRTLGWAAIAPFAGALRWRPCVFITAGSGTGKSTILELIINPISNAEEFTGIDTTAAGIRQSTGSDSCAITIDEAEVKHKDPKSKQNRSEIFGIIRQSTSNNAPKAAKGTQDGRGVKYEMKSMFLLNAINPVIDGEADEKRTVRVSLVKAQEDRKSWIAKEKKIKKLINEKVCRGVRAYTWQNLQNIFDLTERVAEFAQIETTVDNRTAYADSLLLAAYIVVFDDQPNPADEYIRSLVKQIYEDHPVEKQRNETEEMVELLLTQTVRDGASEYTMMELLHAIEHGETGSDEDGSTKTVFSRSHARRLAGIHGMGLTPKFNIAIAKNHNKIMSALDSGSGYHHQLIRHPRLLSEGHNVGLGSAMSTQNCVVIERQTDES